MLENLVNRTHSSEIPLDADWITSYLEPPATAAAAAAAVAAVAVAAHFQPAVTLSVS